MDHYDNRTRCPLHLSAPCPADCDYWTKSDAVAAKAAAGVCVYAGCEAASVPPASVCRAHFLGGYEAYRRNTRR